MIVAKGKEAKKKSRSEQMRKGKWANPFWDVKFVAL